MPSFGNTENSPVPKTNPFGSTGFPPLPDDTQSLFTSSEVSMSSSVGNAESHGVKTVSSTFHSLPPATQQKDVTSVTLARVASPFSSTNTFPPLSSATQQKGVTSVTMATVASPFSTNDTFPPLSSATQQQDVTSVTMASVAFPFSAVTNTFPPLSSATLQKGVTSVTMAPGASPFSTNDTFPPLPPATQQKDVTSVTLARVASPFSSTNTFPPLSSATQQKGVTSVTMAPGASPFSSKGIFSTLFITSESSNIPENNGFLESALRYSIPTLIGSVCGSVVGLLVIVAVVRICCKGKTKNPPSGLNSNTAATVSTSGSPHDQTVQDQSLASTQPLNSTQPLHMRGPAVSQPHYPTNPKGTVKPTQAKPLAPPREDSSRLPSLHDDDDEPTYVVPDGAIYMTPEDVLYEMPANSHCEESVDVPDNLHYYQQRDHNLPTDEAGYILVVPQNLKSNS
ncbi:hypothetical protein Bbelb_201900 [Branchiostoma belcheri]|nr:hypothetical protein Bbelb_201900 [Branchiostoma belcheri]